MVSTGTQLANTINATGSGSLVVSGGSLDVDNGTATPSAIGGLSLSGGSLDAGPDLVANGAVLWTGGTLSRHLEQTSGSFTISGSSQAILRGEVNTTSPISITNANFTTAQPTDADPEPILATSSTLTLASGMVISPMIGNALFAAASVAQNTGPTYGFGGFAVLELAGGTTTVAPGTTFNTGSGVVVSLLTGPNTVLDVAGTFDGGIQVPAGNEALIEGTGTINGGINIVGPGIVSPGDPIGTLTVTGSVGVHSGGVLTVNIAGTTAGTGYSQLVLQAGGSFDSGSHLAINDTNGFTPMSGETFEIVSAPAGVGAGFDGVSGQNAGDYAIVPDPHGVTLGLVPLNTVLPTLSGESGPRSAHVGDTLTCSTGSWSNMATGFTYTWYRGGYQEFINDNGSTPYIGSTYVVQPTDAGGDVQCAVVASNTNGPSNQSATTAGTFVSDPPSNTIAPAIVGTAEAGALLSLADGSWQCGSGLQIREQGANCVSSLQHQWERCNAVGAACTPITAQTDATYEVTAADVGATIRAAETVSNAWGDTSSALSPPTAVIAPASPMSTTHGNGTGKASPTVTLLSAKISSKHHTATFHYGGSAPSVRFECALTKTPVRKHAAAKYHACGVTKTFRNLSGGSYVFYVRAVMPGNPPGHATARRFKISRAPGDA